MSGENHRGELVKGFGCFIFTTLSITGITGNSLVIFAILTDPIVQTKNQLSNLAILNLAYTDLMTTSLVSLPAAVVILFDGYTLEPTFCRLWSILNLTGIVATMGLLMVISVERFIAVGWPLHYPQLVTYPRLLTACGYIWTSTCACTFAWSFFSCDYDFWAGVCDFTWQLFGPKVPIAFWYGAACTVWFCLIPSFAILICNLGIVRFAKANNRVGQIQKPIQKVFERRTNQIFTVGRGNWGKGRVNIRNAPSSRNKANSRISKSIVLVTVSYFVLTFPVALIRVVKVLSGPDGPAKYIPGWFTLFCTFLQFTASIVNPLIYGLFRKDFRSSYARVLVRIRQSFQNTRGSV